MKIKMIAIIGVLLLTLGVSVSVVLAHGTHYNLCHHTPGNEVSLTFHTIQGYLGHLGQPHSGQTYDTQGDCEEEEPSPTPSPTPTPEPSPTPDPCEEEEYIVDENGDWYEPEPTPCPSPEPSPTPEPSPSPEPSPEPTRTPEPTPQPQTSSQPGPASAPSCPDSTPPGIANIFVDSGTLNDGKLEVRWTPDEPKANKAHIRYSEEDGNWRYSLLNTDNDGREEIGGLANGTHYWFQVAQVNGCAVGPWSSSFDPLP